MDKLKILVCFYRQTYLIPQKAEYFNIQCGKDDTGISLNMTADNSGNNISSRNRYWSEITGMYWAWKNMEKVEYIGLCSYRRFFNFKRNPFSAIKIISIDSIDQIEKIEIPDISKIFCKYDVIIPKPYLYAYSVQKVCNINYRKEDFELLKKTIHEISPDYISAYHLVMCSTNKMIGHNMFIMAWHNFDDFCNWVFSILFEMEKKIDPSRYPTNQIRVFGYMHEILLAVYIEKNRLKKFYSQITWATEDARAFKFNNIFYKLAASIYYNLTKNTEK